jgi:hypothetical protein
MSVRAQFRHHLLRRVEFYVVALALAFVGALVWVVRADAPALVAVAAAVAGMGAMQGLLQWADRERRRRLRAQDIGEIREMLRDQVFNQLAAMRMWMAETPDPETAALLFAEVDGSIDEIASLIDRLSEEQLDTWKLTYANASAHWAPADLSGA